MAEKIQENIREFDTGATRDTDVGKLSYIKGLCPNVLRGYMQYLDKHRRQSDGNMRDFDNWKKGIEKDVYLDSLGRHFWDVWLIMHGFEVEDKDGKKVCLKDALHGILFNDMGILYELEKEK